jgi:hypothetical protein
MGEMVVVGAANLDAPTHRTGVLPYLLFFGFDLIAWR